jgi:hypothetical protein
MMRIRDTGLRPVLKAPDLKNRDFKSSIATITGQRPVSR